MRPEIRIGRRRKVTWEDIRQKIVNTEMILWDLLLHTSYILAIICMMVSLCCTYKSLCIAINITLIS